MEKPETNYKNALETLISAQELIIKYSRSEIINRVTWGILFFAIAFVPPYTVIWINVILLIIAGINLHSAVTEYRFYTTFKDDLEMLKLLELKKTNE